jgi:nicotinic acid mononucleotide adenylyltransferase
VFSDRDVEALRSATSPTLLLQPDPGRVVCVALLPGSFDPITVAHAALADSAGEWADAVVLVYSVRTVAKDAGTEPPLLPEPERIEALREFSAARGLMVGLCSHGLLVDQVRAAEARFPSAELTLVVGSDKVLQLFDPLWYQDREAALEGLFGRATVRYAIRSGEAEAVRAALADPANARWSDRLRQIDVARDAAAVSSRLVRAHLREGRDVSHLVPPGVRVPRIGNSRS